jgi:hypothetical protein
MTPLETSKPFPMLVLGRPAVIFIAFDEQPRRNKQINAAARPRPRADSVTPPAADHVTHCTSRRTNVHDSLS